MSSEKSMARSVSRTPRRSPSPAGTAPHRTEQAGRGPFAKRCGEPRRSTGGSRMILPFHGRTPRIAASAFVAPTATVIGDVTIGEEASVWFGAVLRGDVGRIEIGARTSVQDNAVLHTTDRIATIIGDDVTIGHGAVLEGCTVERGALVGMNAVVLHDAVV